MKAADLFCGAGGASLGLIAAGFDMVYALDADADAVATYRQNIGDHVHLGKIENVDPNDIPDIDHLHGSPPCQGFSFAGKRDADDPRNQLWEEYFRIVKAKRPAFISMENVRGILGSRQDLEIVRSLEGIGYRVAAYLVNTADYGVPQIRDRVFYIGNRLGLANPAPVQTHWGLRRQQKKRKKDILPMLGLIPWVTVGQAFGYGGSEPSHTIRSGTHGQPGYSPRHQGGYVFTEVTDHGVLDLDSPSCAIKAGGGKDVSGHEGGATPPSIPNIPLDAPSPIILGGASGDGSSHTGGAEPVRHRLKSDPNEPRMMLRRLTPRECATLQDFPEWFEFTGTKTSQHRQIGNAVPPGMAKAIGLAIIGVMKDAERDAA